MIVRCAGVCGTKIRRDEKLICKVCGETHKHYARGMCKKCYDEWYYTIQHDLNQKVCKVCGQKRTHRALGMCKQCYYASRDPKKRREEYENRIHKKGKLLLSENKTCSMYLGVHIAERILAMVFENVERMPSQNPGFDFICSKGKKIDVKSSCIRIRKNRPAQWAFTIKKNTIPDFFLCIAFDDRENLNPLHMWLIPNYEINMYNGVSISETTLSKWNEFKLSLDDVLSCCNSLKDKTELI